MYNMTGHRVHMVMCRPLTGTMDETVTQGDQGVEEAMVKVSVSTIISQ